MNLPNVLQQIDDNQPEALERLLDLLRIQSVSTDPDYAEHCQRAAQWLVDDLNSIGIEASARQTPARRYGQPP